MTIASTTSVIQYSPNGSTFAFAFPYLFLDNSHIQVIVTSALGVDTTLALTTNYTLVGAGLPGGGTVTCLVAPAAGTRLTIRRVVPVTQLVDYVANDAFPAETHEGALDKLTMIVQQISTSPGSDISRSIKFPSTEPTSANTTLPNNIDRRGMVISFDPTTGDMLVTQELGTWQGSWLTGSAYLPRDLFFDPVTSDVYIVVSAHTSSTIAGDLASGKISLVIASTHSSAQAACAASAAAALVSQNAAAVSAAAALVSQNAAAGSAAAALVSQNAASGSAAAALVSQNAAAASAANPLVPTNDKVCGWFRYGTSDQTITALSEEQVSIGSTLFSNEAVGEWNAMAGTWTVGVAGLYALGCGFMSGFNIWPIISRVRGGVRTRIVSGGGDGIAAGSKMEVAGIALLAVGDVITFRAYNWDVANKDILGAAGSDPCDNPHMYCYLLSRTP